MHEKTACMSLHNCKPTIDSYSLVNCLHRQLGFFLFLLVLNQSQKRSVRYCMHWLLPQAANVPIADCICQCIATCTLYMCVMLRRNHRAHTYPPYFCGPAGAIHPVNSKYSAKQAIDEFRIFCIDYDCPGKQTAIPAWSS